jgi:hypothetical protein
MTNVYETKNLYWISNILSLGKYYVGVTAVDVAGNESVKSNIVSVTVKRW